MIADLAADPQVDTALSIHLILVTKSLRYCYVRLG
jgi:hypothetical protein